MTAPSPGIISSTMLNAFYDSQEAYLAAIAREMRNEYLAIHKAGLLLQIDSPDLAMDRSMFYRDLVRRRVRQSRRDARRGDQQRDRGHPARSRSPALLLGQLGWSAHPRRAAGADPAGAVPGERRGAEHRIRQSAASARVRGAATASFAGSHGADSGNDRHDDEYRRASAGGRAADSGGGGGGGRSGTGDRQRGLRIRNVHRSRVGDRAGGVVEVEVAAGRGGYRVARVCGAEAKAPQQACRLRYFGICGTARWKIFSGALHRRLER